MDWSALLSGGFAGAVVSAAGTRLAWVKWKHEATTETRRRKAAVISAAQECLDSVLAWFVANDVKDTYLYRGHMQHYYAEIVSHYLKLSVLDTPPKAMAALRNELHNVLDSMADTGEPISTVKVVSMVVLAQRDLSKRLAALGA